MTMKSNLEKFVNVTVAIVALAGLLGSFVLLPYRVAALEKDRDTMRAEMKTTQAAAAVDHDTLIRIEERIVTVQQRLGINENKQQMTIK